MLGQIRNRFFKWYESCRIPEGTYGGLRACLFPPDFVLSWLAKRSYPLYRVWDGWASATRVAFPARARPDDHSPECFSPGPAILGELRAAGAVKVSDAFPPSFIADARDYVLRRFHQAVARAEPVPGETVRWIEGDGTSVEVSRSSGHYRFHFPNDPARKRRLPAVIREFMRLPKTHRLIEKYYRMAVRPCDPYTIGEVMVPAPKVTQWHIDCLRQGVKAMLYLSDVGPGQAPFRYLAGSHVPGAEVHHQIYRMGRSGLDESSYDDKTNALYDQRATVFTAPANTLVLFDNRGIHAGSLCTEGIRVTLVNGFRPACSTRINPRFLPDLPPEGRNGRAG
jgi:hypothetical protein